MSYLTNPYMVTPAAIPCTSGQIVGETNTGTVCTGWGTGSNSVWAAISSATLAENDKIEKIGVKIGTVYFQPTGTKYAAYSDDGGAPDEFICMTASTILDGFTGWSDLDVVNGAGVVEPHVITASEAGYIWICWWGEKVAELCFKTGVYSNVMDQTYDSSNTAEPNSPFTIDASHLAQLRGRLTICQV